MLPFVRPHPVEVGVGESGDRTEAGPSCSSRDWAPSSGTSDAANSDSSQNRLFPMSDPDRHNSMRNKTAYCTGLQQSSSTAVIDFSRGAVTLAVQYFTKLKIIS